MALLTIPSVVKGVQTSITLDKSVLFAISAVASNADFSNSQNVAKCIVEYRSTAGGQKKKLFFDLSKTSPTAPILISVRGRSEFSISKIVLEDFDGGALIVSGASIPSGLSIVIA